MSRTATNFNVSFDPARVNVQRMLQAVQGAGYRAIAAETGIDEVHAELLPADKARVIDAMVAKHK